MNNKKLVFIALVVILALSALPMMPAISTQAEADTVKSPRINGLGLDSADVAVSGRDEVPGGASLNAPDPARTIKLIAPNGGETLIGGSTFDIQWVTSGAGGYVHFWYSTDGGETYPNSIDCVPNPLITRGNATYSWFVPPNVNSSTVRVKANWIERCTGIAGFYATDESDYNFTIQKGVAIRFTSVPAQVSAGKSCLICWSLYDPRGLVGAVDLQLAVRTEGGWGDWGSRTRYQPTESGTWLMPPYYENATAKWRLRALSDWTTETVLAECVSREFLIKSPVITLTSLNGGETLIGGQAFDIKWRTANDAEDIIIGVEIYYSTDGGVNYIGITGSTDNDFEYTWSVPAGVNSDRVKIKVAAQSGEWYPFASDESDTNNTIISDPNTVTVSLIEPNPIVEGGIALPGGSFHTIKWKTTGRTADIDHFELYNSTDGGITFSHIATAIASQRTFNWLVPEIDCDTARVKVICHLRDGTRKAAASNNNFYIYTTRVINACPIANAGDNQEVNEGSVVTLDGTGSRDPNGDRLTYSWRQVDSTDFRVSLENPNTARPTFVVPNIRDIPVTLMFELTVSDGIEHVTFCADSINRVSIKVNPTGPTITSFSPTGGWAGVPVTIQGTNLGGAEIYIGGVRTATVPLTPTPDCPHPDTSYTFTIVPEVPHHPDFITVRSRAGEASSSNKFEVYPVPEYCYNWGFKFHNPSDDVLSYPWLVWNEGQYRDTFGDNVYIRAWVCIGIPYWWGGWKCEGYLIEEPIAPDPLAALFYTAGYWWLARDGECFGMSSNSLQFHNGEIRPRDFDPSGSWKVNQLDHAGELDRRIEYMHGSQVSAECLRWYSANVLASTQITAEGQRAAMRLWLEMVRHAVDSGNSGIISMLHGVQGHVVVPYLVEDVDADHTRIYVYDCNREWFSQEATAVDALTTKDPANNYPPYIEIDKSGDRWKWSFEQVNGDDWGSWWGIFFLPYGIVNGDRTLPTSWEGMLTFICGDASDEIEDESGRSLGIDEHGELVAEIPEAIPIPGAEGKGYALPFGDYTTHIRGQANGSYSWAGFGGGSSAFALEDAEVTGATEDTVTLNYEDGNPLAGAMSLETSDTAKKYNATIIKQFKQEAGSVERVFRVKNTSTAQGSVASFQTSPDCNSLVYTNNGPLTITYDVEFQTNMVCKEVADRGPITKLPTATRSGLVIGPYEKHVLTPENWLDLDQTTINLEIVSIGEGHPPVTPSKCPPGCECLSKDEGYEKGLDFSRDEKGDPIICEVIDAEKGIYKYCFRGEKIPVPPEKPTLLYVIVGVVVVVAILASFFIIKSRKKA